MQSPRIVLVRPQMGENIGAAARAMANFGLKNLHLVAPRDGWPNPKASDMAGRALNIIDDAALHSTTQEALAECQFVLATTARERAMNLPVLEPREAIAELHRRASAGQQTAILFGPERTGLENEEVVLADAVVTIPVAPEYASLNLGQAVVILGYEWHLLSSLQGVEGDAAIHLPAAPQDGLPRSARNDETPAPRALLEGLFGHLEQALDGTNFWRIPAKKEIMWRNIRAGLTRAGLTEQEVATWRGIVKALSEK